MNGSEKFIDTNLIIYYLEINQEFYPQVKEIFKKAEEDKIQLVTSTISYMEAIIPIVKKEDINLRFKYDYLFKGFTGLKVADIDMDIAYIGAVIRAKYGIRTPDALQIGCAIRSGCDEFFTADTRLKIVEEMKITVIEPNRILS